MHCLSCRAILSNVLLLTYLKYIRQVAAQYRMRRATHLLRCSLAVKSAKRLAVQLSPNT